MNEFLHMKKRESKNLFSYIQELIQSISIIVLLSYINMYSRIITTWEKMCLSKHWLPYSISVIKHIIRGQIANFIGYEIEPLHQNWISISILSNEYSDTPYKCEQYYIEFSPFIDKLTNRCNTDDSFNNRVLLQNFFFLCDYSEVFFQTIPNIHEVMITNKINRRYNNYVIFNTQNVPIFKPYNESSDPSSEKFLTIQYKHPDLDNSIQTSGLSIFIDLNEDMYSENTAILSPLFVKKYLDTYYPGTPFDMRYKLYIIDNHIKEFDIDSSKYIRIEKQDYRIIDISE